MDYTVAETPTAYPRFTLVDVKRPAYWTLVHPRFRLSPVLVEWAKVH